MRAIAVPPGVGPWVSASGRKPGTAADTDPGLGDTIMAPDADLYLDRMELQRYCEGETCALCKVDSFEEFVARLGDGRLKGGTCPHWSEARIKAFRLAADAGTVIPPVPMLDLPRPVEPGVLELNDPGPEAPLLITGNSQFTQSVMLAVLSYATGPLRLLTVDVRGHTVDMAVVFGEFTVEKVMEALDEFGVDGRAAARVILPGLTGEVASELSARLERECECGPICAAELPLYLGTCWTGE